MKVQAIGSQDNSEQRSHKQMRTVIHQINALLEESTNSRLQKAEVGETFFIISEKNLIAIRDSLRNKENSETLQEQLTNADIVEESESKGYTYYEPLLKKEVSEENDDPNLRIVLLDRKVYLQLAKQLKWRGKAIERRVMKCSGQKRIQLHPCSLQIEILALKTMRDTQTSSRQSNFEKDLVLQKLRFNFYRGETIQLLAARINKEVFKGNAQIKLYSYDPSLFKQVSFPRMIEYFFKKENVSLVNKDQQNFYNLKEKRGELSQDFLLQFFPGKLLIYETAQTLKQMNIQRLILELYDNSWIFPQQPYYSTSGSCRFCMMKMQLYIDFNCSKCKRRNLFCSQICHYQFLLEHPCKEAKEEIIERYGENDANQASDSKIENSEIKLNISNVVEYSNSDAAQGKVNFSLNSLAIVPVGKKKKQAKDIKKSYGGGMTNIGNSCYLNASLQNLARTSLTQELLKMQKKIRSSKISPLANAYLTLLKKLEKTTSYQHLSYVEMEDFKNIINTQIQQFDGSQQHDAHEFIMFFCDRLSEELNLNRGIKQKLKEIECKTSEKDEFLAKNEWLKFISNNNSPIVHLFYGQLKTQIDCPHCHTTNKRFDSFNILSIPIPERNQTFTADVFYESYQFKEKIKYLKFEVIGCLMEDLIRNALIRFNLPDYKFRLTKAYILGHEGDCVEVKNTERISSVLSKLNKAGDEQNQLFLLELPCEEPTVLFFKFLHQDKGFTFKKPIFFPEPKTKLRNFKIYHTIIEYLLNMTAHYMPTDAKSKKKFEDLKQRMQLNVGAYFRIKIKVFSEEQQEPLQLFPNTDIQSQLLKKCELWVHIQNFDSLFTRQEGTKEAEVHNIILNKLNKFTKISDIKVKIKYDIKETPQIIEDCLKEEFNRKELLDSGNEWFCSTCNEKRRVHQTTLLYKANKYLFIHIKRFKRGSDGQFYKNCSKVKLSLELDLNNILNNPTLPENYYKNLSDNDLITYNLPKVLDTKESYHYNMIGMILHHGKIGSGHYTALFKDGDWWEYNDQEASRRNIQDVLNETITMEKVYILLYERVS